MRPGASSRLAALLRGTGLFNDSQIEELSLKQRDADGCLTAATVLSSTSTSQTDPSAGSGFASVKSIVLLRRGSASGVT